jgi:hypothetical protein
MSNGNGHHWSKFCWRDHMADPALRDCSLSSKGFWIGILALMHECTPVGHLTIGGKQATPRQMASYVNCTLRQAEKALAELEAAGVYSRTPDGTIYSRRMVKDAAASEAGREHIAKRWNGTKPAETPPPPKPGPISPPIREPISEPTSQAFRDPNSPPNRTPITKSQIPESEVEPEKEERKFSNLTYTSPVLARVAAACETPPAGTFGSEPEPEPASNALQFATQNIVGKVARKLESSGKSPPGKRAHLTVVQQIDAVLRGPVLDEEALVGDIMPPIRGPQPPQRTVAEQLAALGFPQHTIEATP